MLYRNDERLNDLRWLGEPNLAAGEIVREFLSGERDLLELEHGHTPAVEDLDWFLEGAAERPICVERAATGQILIRAVGFSGSLLVTGRTADVLSGYLDSTPVWMEDRSEMTLRRRPQSL